MDQSTDPWTWRAYQQAVDRLAKGVSDEIKWQEDAFFTRQAKFDAEGERNRAQFDIQQRRRLSSVDASHAGVPRSSQFPATEEPVADPPGSPTLPFSPVTSGPAAQLRGVVVAQLAREEEAKFHAEEEKRRAEFMAEVTQQLPLATLSVDAQFTIVHELHPVLLRNLVKVAMVKQQLVSQGMAADAATILDTAFCKGGPNDYSRQLSAATWQQQQQQHQLVKEEAPPANERPALVEVKKEPYSDDGDGNATPTSSEPLPERQQEGLERRWGPQTGRVSTRRGGVKKENTSEGKKSDTDMLWPESMGGRVTAGRGAVLTPTASSAPHAAQGRGGARSRKRVGMRESLVNGSASRGRERKWSAARVAPLYLSRQLTRVVVSRLSPHPPHTTRHTGAGNGASLTDVTALRGRTQRETHALLREAQPLLQRFVDRAMDGVVRQETHEADGVVQELTRVVADWEQSASAALTSHSDGRAASIAQPGAVERPLVSLYTSASEAGDASRRQGATPTANWTAWSIASVKKALTDVQAKHKKFLASVRKRRAAQKRVALTVMMQCAVLTADRLVPSPHTTHAPSMSEVPIAPCGIPDDGLQQPQQYQWIAPQQGTVAAPVATPEAPHLTVEDAKRLLGSLVNTPSLSTINFFGAKRLANPTPNPAFLEDGSDKGSEDTGRGRPLHRGEELLLLPDETAETDAFLERQYLWPAELERRIAHQLSGVTRPRPSAGNPLSRRPSTTTSGWSPLMMSAVELGDVFALALNHEIGIRTAATSTTSFKTKSQNSADEDRRKAHTATEAVDVPADGEDAAEVVPASVERSRKHRRGEGRSGYVSREVDNSTARRNDAEADTLDGFADHLSQGQTSGRRQRRWADDANSPGASAAHSSPLARSRDKDAGSGGAEVGAAVVHDTLAACYRIVCTSSANVEQEKKHKVRASRSKWLNADKLNSSGVLSAYDLCFADRNTNRPRETQDDESCNDKEENNELATLVPTSLTTVQFTKQFVNKRFHHVSLPGLTGATLLHIEGAGEFAAARSKLTSAFAPPLRNEELIRKLTELEEEGQ